MLSLEFTRSVGDEPLGLEILAQQCQAMSAAPKAPAPEVGLDNSPA